VREPYEHERDHIEGDVLVPLAALLDNPHVVGSGPVVVYCATGSRSARAAAALRSVGIGAVSLRGGIEAWRASNPR
jgi:adenylyltransferase/sulfurtransferase